ncbi:hypothetical protein [Microbacterium sp.]|uniref:hypothetical protein n=1 Tax=Microbacterium sp. TaxID=51671 RepID=UPI003C75FF6E
MDDRPPSPHETRARMGFSLSIIAGIIVTAVLMSLSDNTWLSVGIGLIPTIVLMVLFTRRPRRQHPDVGDGTDAGPTAGGQTDSGDETDAGDGPGSADDGPQL